MALDKVLKIYDENGNPVDYDILASDVKFLPDGKDLPTKLTEMEDAIEDAAEGGGYTPPQGGIPKTDLAPSVQTSLGLADTALQPADKTQLQNAITSLQNTLNTLIGSGNVQGAIDTFNEVKAFLNGIDTSDPTLFNQLKSLSDAISALQNTLSQKANSSDVANTYATKSELSGKQNTLTFDNAPTAGSNNPVKSGGIKTAIDQVTPTIDANGKWVIGGVTTDKDAQGPRGNTVLVNENAVGIQGLIVNNVVDGGETDILSAEMGKVLRQNIVKIFNALGNYAFPEGKPVLNWDSTVINHSINVNGVTGGLTIADVEVDGVSAASLPAQIAEGKSLSLRLVLPSDLYVFNDGVSITMGGVNITTQQGVWDESTGEINIAAVIDDIVISANAMTYEQSGLVLHLDCRHRGGTGTEVSGHWKSLVNYGQSPIDFALGSAVVAADSGMVFDGTSNSYAETDTALNVMATDGTIEVVATIVDSESNNHMNTIFVNPIENAIGLSIFNAAADDGHRTATIMMGRSNSNYSGVGKYWAGRVGDTTTDFAIAVTAGTPNGVGHNKGTELTLSSHYHLVVDATAHNKLMIGRSKRSAGDRLLVGTIRSIRVYSGHLSADQQQHNWLIDKKRFNL